MSRDYNMPCEYLKAAHKTSNATSLNMPKQHRINMGKKQVVDKFMNEFDGLIQSTIRRNNDTIYTNLLEFLAPQKMGIQAQPAFD